MLILDRIPYCAILTSAFLYCRNVLISFSFNGFSFWPRSFRNVATLSGFLAILMSNTNSE